MNKRIRCLVYGIALMILSFKSYAISCTNWENTAIAATTSHLQINPDNVDEVIDYNSGLIWQRCSVGQGWNGVGCSGSAIRMTWSSALDSAEMAGAEWRLPDIKELSSIVEQRCYGPAINGAVFPGTSSSYGYWSSSTYSAAASGAWVVDFISGTDDVVYKSTYNFVRLVRSGQ